MELIRSFDNGGPRYHRISIKQLRARVPLFKSTLIVINVPRAQGRSWRSPLYTILNPLEVDKWSPLATGLALTSGQTSCMLLCNRNNAFPL